ncbi:MAG: hypothetical protein WD845_07795 [Pirellulales bacterium]
MAARNDGLLDAPAQQSSTSLADATEPVSAPASDGMQQACRRTAERLRARAGGALRVIERPPFVIGGDLGEDELAACHAETIAPAVQAMQCRYFRSRPHQPVTVLLFAGEASYNRYSREWYGDSDVSVYGYYKPNERTLLVNHATGNGTLLHELTHALFDFEMDDPPVWLNEGLASLHEQCRFRADDDGPWIEGLVNWRLEGLQTVIRQGRLRSLVELVEERDFRGPLVGTNYAQARYFCMYLQQQRRLADFFRDFRDHRSDDAAGAAAIVRAMHGQSWDELDRDFQRWVLELSP